MAITWYSIDGQPTDATGSDGDLNFARTTRMVWGPKGAITAGSWAGTANSNMGPTGPAQLAGVGPPSNTYGQNGNGYTDEATGLTYYKSSNTWAQVGSIIGPQGVVGDAGLSGFSALTTQASTLGSQTNFVATVSATPTPLTNPGTSVPLTYTPLQSSALTGLAVANNGVAVTLTLVNTTTGATVNAFSIAPGNIYNSYTLTQYPLVAGNVYQWNVTGSGSGNFQFQAFYLSPAAATANTVSTLTGFSTAASTTFSNTIIYPGPFGRNSTSGTCRSVALPRVSALYAVTGTYLPSVAGAAAASVTCTLYGYNIAAATTATYATFALPNTGLARVALGPLVNLTSMPVGVAFYFGITGSGTGQVSLDVSVVQ